MKVMAFAMYDFDLINEMRLYIHNQGCHSLSYDEQRDFAERLRLLLERGQVIDLDEYEFSKRKEDQK